MGGAGVDLDLAFPHVDLNVGVEPSHRLQVHPGIRVGVAAANRRRLHGAQQREKHDVLLILHREEGILITYFNFEVIGFGLARPKAWFSVCPLESLYTDKHILSQNTEILNTSNITAWLYLIYQYYEYTRTLGLQ